jgi:hypothetical protein
MSGTLLKYEEKTRGEKVPKEKPKKIKDLI